MSVFQGIIELRRQTGLTQPKAEASRNREGLREGLIRRLWTRSGVIIIIGPRMNPVSRRSLFRWHGPRRGDGAEYICCAICHRAFRTITFSHLRFSHRLSVSAYRGQFPEHPLTCLEVREKESISQARRYQALGRHWSKKRVIRLIRARATARRELNLGVVKTEDERLVEAGLRYFGSWDDSLRAARIDPEAVRKWNRWTPKVFQKRLTELKKAGIRLSWAAVRKRDPKLMKAAYVQFGSWTKALRAFGEEPLYEHVRWTKAEVLRRILERGKRGQPLYARFLMLNGPGKLYGAARAKFGSWGKALRAAGIDPGTIHRRRAWTMDNVLSSIRKACRRRKPFGLEDEDPGLVAAARKFYGGWHEALGAAGIWSPKNRSGYRWTRKELLAALNSRVRDGRSMRPTDVKDEANDLYMAARKLYGGLRDAAKAAGCLSAVPPPRASWPADDLVRLLRRLGRKGPVFRRKLSQVKRKGYGTPAASIRRIWGTFRKAKRIAGVV